MHRVAVGGSLVRWHRLVLVLGVVVAAWGPAHSAEVAASAHGVEVVAGAHGAVARESPDVFRVSGQEPVRRDDHRCGHRDVERDATQATAVRLPQPSMAPGLAMTTSSKGEPRTALVDHGEPRASPGAAVFVNVCVWRQ
jgi:hypothetical protein